MRTSVRVAAAAVIFAAVTAGCVDTTTGTVATTTEPGPPLTTTSPTRTSPTPQPAVPLPDIPLPPGNIDLPEVPAPPDATTMSCGEFNELDRPTRLAVVRAILSAENSALGPGHEQVAMTLAESVCQFFFDITVNEILVGEPPR